MWYRFQLIRIPKRLGFLPLCLTVAVFSALSATQSRAVDCQQDLLEPYSENERSGESAEVNGPYQASDYLSNRTSVLGFLDFGRPGLYPQRAADMANRVIRMLTQGEPFAAIFHQLSDDRWHLAVEMFSKEAFPVARTWLPKFQASWDKYPPAINSFGQLRFTRATRTFERIDGYSEVFFFGDSEELEKARKRDLLDFYVQYSNQWKNCQEVVATEGQNEARRLDLFSSLHRRGSCVGYNFYQSSKLGTVPLTAMFQKESSWPPSAQPLKVFSAVHPSPEKAEQLWAEVLERFEELRKTPDPKIDDLLDIMFLYYNTVPYHRGSAMIGDAILDGFYYFILKTKFPRSRSPQGDFRDLIALLSPSKIIFRQHIQDTFLIGRK